MAMHICRRKLADKVFLLVSIVFLIYVLPHEVASRKVQIHDKNSMIEDRKGKIIETRYEDNEVFDCVDIYEQPAFDHPLLKDHIIQMKPSAYPKENEASQILQGDSTFHSPIRTVDCPEGTIPILRTPKTVTKSPRSFPQIQHFNQSLVQFTSPAGHEYAQVSIIKSHGYKGAHAKLNVWIPPVENNEFSLAQMWIIGGEGNDRTTIEAGWQVASIDNPHRARFFTFWTADNYGSTGCYDIDCPGFVQVNRRFALGGTVKPTSSYNGHQYEIDISIHKDPLTGNWWLRIQNVDLGYWPNSLLPSLRDSASMISWGGEIINSKSQGHHTTTQMGSGHFPNEGYGKSAFISHLMYVDGSNMQKEPQTLTPYTTNSKCYGVSAWTNPVLGVHIFFGGPGFSQQCP